MIYHGILGLFALDQRWKTQIEAEDAAVFPKELKGSGGKIWLYHNQNDGFPFRVLAEKQKLVRYLPMSMLILVIVMLLSPERETDDFYGKDLIRKKQSLYLIFFGGLSNYLDRLRYGYVVDYFSFRFGVLKKVVFNIGDLMIFAGTFWFLILNLFQKRSIK